MTINPIPASLDEWLDEIARAYNEALEAIPFGALTGAEMKPDDLFHLAPAICLDFRGIKRTKVRLKKATDAVLASYTATLDENGKFPGSSIGSFAFGYLAAHFGLDLAKEAAAGFFPKHAAVPGRGLVGAARCQRPDLSAAAPC